MPSAQHSNLGGWQSAPDLGVSNNPAVKELIDFSRLFVNRLTAVNAPQGLIEADLRWKIEGWANMNFSGCANAIHAHPGAYWSVVYWIDDGVAPQEEAIGGELEFYDPAEYFRRPMLRPCAFELRDATMPDTFRLFRRLPDGWWRSRHGFSMQSEHTTGRGLVYQLHSTSLSTSRAIEMI